MVLSIKESISGRTYTLDTTETGTRVCGGKGIVFLQDNQVAVRCCAKASIVATRKLKQSVLRQGDTLLLDVQ